MKQRAWWVIAMALASCACGGGNGTTMVRLDGGDGAAGADTGPRTDAGPPVDTGPPTDTGPRPDTGSGGRMCTHPGGACDVLRQDCPMPTDGCYFAAMEGGMPTTMCVPAGTGGDGAPCEFVNNCLPGFTCNGGQCRRYCCMGAASDCMSPTQFCTPLAGTDIGLCTVTAACTLVPNEGCASGEGCYIASADGTVVCDEAGTIGEGMPCMYRNDCAPGHGCFGRAGGASACTRFCRIAMGMADCGGTRMCQAVTGISLPEGIGLCPPPG